MVTLGQACLWHGDKIAKLAVRPEEGSQEGIAPGVQLESGGPCHTTAPGTERGLLVCFPRKFSLDDLLTGVMLYWTTGTITSSQRFYKENMRLDNKHEG